MNMHSMTGCGTGRVQREGWEVTADLKTVNHRFLDLSMRLPRNISFLEQTVREETGKVLKRGHVDVFLTVRNTESSHAEITVDQDLARQYWEAGKSLFEAVGTDNDLTVSKLLSMEGVTTLTEKEMDQELVSALWGDGSGRKDAKHGIRNLIGDLRETLKQIGMEDVLIRRGAHIAIRPELLDCDYYRMLAGDMAAVNAFRGEYMSNYSWAELTAGALYFHELT